MNNQKSDLTIPICINCKWHTESIMGFPLCVFNATGITDPVTGKVDVSGQTLCHNEREKRWFFPWKHCGPEGRFYEPKHNENE